MSYRAIGIFDATSWTKPAAEQISSTWSPVGQKTTDSYVSSGEEIHKGTPASTVDWGGVPEPTTWDDQLEASRKQMPEDQTTTPDGSWFNEDLESFKSGGTRQQGESAPSGGASTVAMAATSAKNWFDELPTVGKIALVGGAAALLYFAIK